MPERNEEIFVDLSAELRIRGLSSAAQQLYRIEPAAVVGRPLAEVLETDGGRIDWEACWAQVAPGHPFRQVMLHRSCSGLRVWVHARLEAGPFGGRLWVRRASGRDVLEREPGGLCRAIGQMLAIGGIGLWMDDRLSNDFDWSPHTRVLHDLEPDAELSPAALFARIHPEDRNQTALEIQRRVAERLPYDGVVRVTHREHGYRPLRVFGASTYDDAGLPLVAIGGVQDVSEEVALRRRVRELEEQLRAAQRGDVVGRLAGGIAHDFNNILTGILGCCEMLSDGSLSPRQQKDVQQIRAATARAADLTRQLLAFGRRQALRRRAVEPGAVLSDVFGLLRRTVPENVELQLEPAACAGRVLVDVTQLHQVLTNLVVNAAQAMPGGGKIQIGALQQNPPAGAEPQGASGEYICFFVEDSGPGVPEELRSRIFEPFFSTKPVGQGSGLGLSVVQGIVEQHQGHICVGAGARAGARFDVYLPVTQQGAESGGEAAPRRPATPPPASSEQGALRVLLVEDEKMVRELTKRILVGAGVHVADAASAEEALLRAQEDAFDVLLTDVMLPDVSGPELVLRLRAQGLTFRVVYMSGYPADFVESRVQLAADELLVHKPFTGAALLRALRQPPPL